MAVYAWWLYTNGVLRLVVYELEQRWLWMYIIRICMSRNAACCGQADLKIKACFSRKLAYVNSRLFFILYLLCSFLFLTLFFLHERGTR